MSIPKQQKALLIPSSGAPFELRTIEVPKPEAEEVLVRVDVTALNPIDWKAHEWGISITQYPAVLGCEVSGVVVQVGLNVTNRAVGDLV